MKAATRVKYGKPEVLSIKDVEKPIPGDKEVLIKVMVTTVNRTDCAILSAKPFIMRFLTGFWKPKFPIPGTDFAGTIKTIGKDVTKFKVGDNVFGFDDGGFLGSQAEYMTLAENKGIGLIPSISNFKEMAASIEGAHYACNFINKVKLAKEHKVLVNGVTGAIGSAMVQFLKFYGVYVTAVGNTKNLSLIKTLNPDKIIDYEKEDFTKDDQKYDFVMDAVGKSTFSYCKPIMKKNGIYISSELGPYNQNLFYALFSPLFKRKKVVFPIPTKLNDSITFVQDLIEQKKFKPVIDRVYTLGNIQEAYEYVASGLKTGNVLLTFHEEE